MNRIILKVKEVNIVANTVKFDEISENGIRKDKILRISEFEENLDIYEELIAINYKRVNNDK